MRTIHKQQPVFDLIKHSWRVAIATVLATACTLSCAHAAYNPNALTENSVNVSTAHFFQAFMSEDAQQRDRARLYLLGVMDSSEGVSWCDYSTYKIDTLQARIYEALKEADEAELKTKAAVRLKQILEQHYPCRK